MSAWHKDIQHPLRSILRRRSQIETLAKPLRLDCFFMQFCQQLIIDQLYIHQLVGVFVVDEDGFEGHPGDADIEPEAPVLHVPDVTLDALFHLP